METTPINISRHGNADVGLAETLETREAHEERHEREDGVRVLLPAINSDTVMEQLEDQTSEAQCLSVALQTSSVERPPQLRAAPLRPLRELLAEPDITPAASVRSSSVHVLVVQRLPVLH